MKNRGRSFEGSKSSGGSSAGPRPKAGSRGSQKKRHSSGVRRTGKPIRARKKNAPAAVAQPTHACPECGKKFPTEAGMQTHQYNVHGSAPMTVGDLSRCTECGVLVKPKRMKEHREWMHGLR